MKQSHYDAALLCYLATVSGANLFAYRVRGADKPAPSPILLTAGDLDRDTRFEIHDGMLVAIRLDVPEDRPEARGDRLETTAASVLVRERAEPGRARVSLLARDCPTHAAEVARILAGPR